MNKNRASRKGTKRSVFRNPSTLRNGMGNEVRLPWYVPLRCSRCPRRLPSCGRPGPSLVWLKIARLGNAAAKSGRTWVRPGTGWEHRSVSDQGSTMEAGQPGFVCLQGGVPNPTQLAARRSSSGTTAVLQQHQAPATGSGKHHQTSTAAACEEGQGMAGHGRAWQGRAALGHSTGPTSLGHRGCRKPPQLLPWNEWSKPTQA